MQQLHNAGRTAEHLESFCPRDLLLRNERTPVARPEFASRKDDLTGLQRFLIDCPSLRVCPRQPSLLLLLVVVPGPGITVHAHVLFSRSNSRRYEQVTPSPRGRPGRPGRPDPFGSPSTERGLEPQQPPLFSVF